MGPRKQVMDILHICQVGLVTGIVVFNVQHGHGLGGHCQEVLGRFHVEPSCSSHLLHLPLPPYYHVCRLLLSFAVSFFLSFIVYFISVIHLFVYFIYVNTYFICCYLLLLMGILIFLVRPILHLDCVCGSDVPVLLHGRRHLPRHRTPHDQHGETLPSPQETLIIINQSAMSEWLSCVNMLNLKNKK